MEIETPIAIKASFWGRLDDDEFFHFCQENKDWVIERDHEGTIYLMSPIGFKGGMFEASLIAELGLWAKSNTGWVVVSSSTGFIFPDTSVLSPDAAVVSRKRFAAVPEEDLEKFPRISPEFVAEIRSPSDSIPHLVSKMEKYLLNGVQLGWLIDPLTEKAWIYRPEQEPELVEGFDQVLSGGNVLPGFEFSLSLLK